MSVRESSRLKCKKAYCLICAILFILLVLTYRNLFNLFYQQDEWATLGMLMSGGLRSYLKQYSFVEIISGTGRVFSLFFHYPAYVLFAFQIWPFTLFSLFAHFVNALLVYIFAYKLTGKFVSACVGSIFFICSSVSSQSVSWFAANTTTLPSTTFLLLSFLIAILGSERRRFIFFFIAQCFVITSFLFKESGIIGFIVVPYLYFVWGKHRLALSKAFMQMIPLLIYGFFILGVNIYRIVQAPLVSNSSFVENSIQVWPKLFIHVFLYPSVSLSQLFIPRTIMYSMARSFQTVAYSQLERFTSSQLGVESIVSDFVSFVISIGIVGIVLILALKVKKYRKILLFSLCFTLLSFLPFIVLEKQHSYLDSRYFYNGIIGGGLLLGSCMHICIDIARQLGKRVSYMIIFFLIIGFGLFIRKHIQYVQRDIRVLVIESSERIQFFKQLQSILPKLPERSVVYVTGNNYGYYGIPSLKIPFQQGPGYTLMVWYYKDNVIPSEFIRDYFLWRVEDQGYKELRDKAFGYYFDLSTLKQLVINGTIDISQIIGLYYDTDSKKLTDITLDTKNIILNAFDK